MATVVGEPPLPPWVSATEEIMEHLQEDITAPRPGARGGRGACARARPRMLPNSGRIGAARPPKISAARGRNSSFVGRATPVLEYAGAPQSTPRDRLLEEAAHGGIASSETDVFDNAKVRPGRGSPVPLPIDICRGRPGTAMSFRPSEGTEDKSSGMATPPLHLLGAVGAELWGSTPTEVEKRGELHPVVRAAREEHVKTALLVGDITKSPELASHFQNYNVTDFFDQQGLRRYPNLSMSLVVRHQNGGNAFGSVQVAKPHRAASSSKDWKHSSARAYRLATEVVHRDREQIRRRNLEQYNGLGEAERIQTQHVRRRQHEMLFLEIPDTDESSLPNCAVQTLLPPESSRAQERDERKRFDRMNGNLMEKSFQNINYIQQQGWLFSYDDIHETLKCISVWSASVGLPATLGIDRSTFCRFLLDLDMVDQDSLQYVWAISVFDRHARPMRVSHGDPDLLEPHLEGRVPVMPLICKWDFFVTIDALVRQRFGGSSCSDFMNRMRILCKRLEKDCQQRDTEEVDGEAPHAVEEHWRPGHSGLVGTPGPQHNLTAGFDAEEKLPVAAPTTSTGAGALWRRNRLISSMLVEPEVLQLVEQYRHLFETFFRTYLSSDDIGAEDGDNSNSRTPSMEFVDFLQFCHDFHIIPQLASRHEVMRAYRASVCVDIAAAAPSKSTERYGSGNRCESPCSTGSAASRAGSPTQSWCPVDVDAARGEEPLSPLSPGAAAKRPPGHRTRLAVAPQARRRNTRTKVRAPHVEIGRLDGEQPPEEQGPPAAAEEPLRTVEEQASFYCFGLGAFVETLCRIVFMFMFTYGNPVQLATSSRAKAAWLVTYLYGVHANLQKSHGRRSREGAAEGGGNGNASQTPSPRVSQRLVRLLEQLEPAAFQAPVPPELQKPPCEGEGAPGADAAAAAKRHRPRTRITPGNAIAVVCEKGSPTHRQGSPTHRSKGYMRSSTQPLRKHLGAAGGLPGSPQSLPQRPASQQGGRGRQDIPLKSAQTMPEGIRFQAGGHTPRTMKQAAIGGLDLPPPREDATKFKDFLLHSLLRNSFGRQCMADLDADFGARAAALGDDAQQPQQLRAGSKGGVANVRGAWCLESERKALADLNTKTFDRSDLTPPPPSLFASQLREGVFHLMSQKVAAS